MIERAKQLIAKQANGPLTLSGVAQQVDLSPQHFCKVFKQPVGTTFTDYVSKVRIEKALILLDEPNRRISEVAYEAGFKSISQFNRTFSRIPGLSPSAYQKSASKSPPPEPANSSYLTPPKTRTLP